MNNGFTFSQVPVADIPRSVFNRSHEHKSAFDAGYIVPIFVDEALPGDTFSLSTSVLARLSTPIFPIMDNMYLDFFFFAVPNRLVWDNWQKFCGEQLNPGDSTDFVIPQCIAPAGGFPFYGLFDYMGIPPGVPNLSVSALFGRAFNLIYNEWFRDENLSVRLEVPKGDGPDNYLIFGNTAGNCPDRLKRHDYFTSCLPWPMKGDGVSLSLGAFADVVPTGDRKPTFTTADNAQTDWLFRYSVDTVQSSYIHHGSDYGATGNTQALKWADTKLVADLGSAAAVTINSMRQAFQIQRLLERDARGGTRYIELLRAHFGVVSPDGRAQRPEYLGGGTIPFVINPVTQTAASNEVTPQGNLAAYGLAAGRGLGFTKSFVEHSIIIGVCAARADMSYQQGCARMFNRKTRYDFYWPAFAHLGEQAVLNKEIYAQGPNVKDGNLEVIDDKVFGYQERWAEYRYFPSKITGTLRSTAPQSLDAWHLGEKFNSLPALNPAFISDQTMHILDRVLAVSSEPNIIFDSHFNLKCVRPMPTYSVPGMIDHF